MFRLYLDGNSQRHQARFVNLIHGGLNKMVAILQMTFWNIFSGNCFSPNRWQAISRTKDDLVHECVTRHQVIRIIRHDTKIHKTGMECSFWLHSLWPHDAIWWHRSGSTLAQLMACCLMAPSHYLNQCWLMIIEVQWQTPYAISQ